MKKKKRLKRILPVVLAVLFLLYIGLANILVSAALVPSFMERLEAFSRITEDSVNALVHTSDIQQQYQKSWEETREWAKNAHGQKLTKETEDGYKLVAQEVYTEEESISGYSSFMGIRDGKRLCIPLPCGITSEAIMCSLLTCGVREKVKETSSEWAGQTGEIICSGWTTYWNRTLRQKSLSTDSLWERPVL